MTLQPIQTKKQWIRLKCSIYHYATMLMKWTIMWHTISCRHRHVLHVSSSP